ncbi:hypothetical protein BDP27DRAFT_1327992 [Rhodocollybia butyracea]|uniref:Uncharacterized protein n=1 Tax=Rhodocollybia butyracea TaxID=206335 RepID=A0A9P5PR49_9AGAR|nr:hypothetical protein BDP27DRAFT_1327992 [Rhodocollybia butyracea]
MSLTTDAEVEVFRQSLAETTDFRVFPLLVETILWTIFTVLIFTMSYIVMSSRALKNNNAHPHACNVWTRHLDWAIDVRRVWTDLNISIPAELSSQDNESALNTENILLRIIQAITNNICVVIGDMIVCWRVCVVCRWKKSVIATGIFLLLSLVSTVFICNLTQIGVGFPNVTHLQALAPSQLYIDIIALSFSALINIWATSMIALQAWIFRREIRQYLSNSDRKSCTESVLTLFVETGAAYTVLWILKNVIIIPQVSPTPYVNYANFIMNIVVGMYPTLILILVALQRSHLEYQFQYESDDSANTGPLRFAPATSLQQSVSNVSVGGNMVVSIPHGQRLANIEIPYESSTKTGSSETLKIRDENFSREGMLTEQITRSHSRCASI